MALYEHSIDTKGATSMVSITRQVRDDIAQSGVAEGIAVVYSPHTTAGITINENADPDVVRDVLMAMEEVFPTDNPRYRHFEGNSHAHIKTTCFGPSQTLIITNGAPVLGVWQDVYFCDFDGPRHRHYYVKVIAG